MYTIHYLATIYCITQSLFSLFLINNRTLKIFVVNKQFHYFIKMPWKKDEWFAVIHICLPPLFSASKFGLLKFDCSLCLIYTYLRKFDRRGKHIFTVYGIRMLITRFKVNIIWSSSANLFMCEGMVAVSVGCALNSGKFYFNYTVWIKWDNQYVCHLAYIKARFLSLIAFSLHVGFKIVLGIYHPEITPHSFHFHTVIIW